MRLRNIGFAALIALLTNAATPFTSSFPILFSKTRVLAQAASTQVQEALRLMKQGEQQFNTSQYQVAIESFQQALAIYKAIANREGEGYAILRLGNSYLGLEDVSKAINYYQQSLVLAREVGSRDLEGRSLHNLGNVYNALKDYAKVIEYCQQALTIAREIKNREIEEKALGVLGDAFNALEDHTKATEYYQQALTIAREIKDRQGEERWLYKLGIAYFTGTTYKDWNFWERNKLGNEYLLLEEDYAKAIEYYQQKLATAHESQDRQEEGRSLYVLGTIYLFLGEYAKAIDYFHQSLTIAQELKDRRMEGYVLVQMGWTYGYQENNSKAIESEQKALTIAREIKDRELEASALNILGQAAHFLQHDYSAAINYYQQALTLVRELKDREAEGALLSNLGISYDALGNYDKAIKSHQQGLTIAREFKDSQAQGLSLNYLGLALLHAGKLEEAQKTLLTGIEVWESIRAKLGGQDSLKISFVDRRAETYDILQRVYIAQNKPETALEISERSRARTFVDLLARRLSSNPTVLTQITPPTIEQIKQIAKNQNATLVQYSVIYDDLRGRGKPQAQESKLYIWVIKPTGEVIFRQADLSTLLKSQNISLAELVSSSRSSIGVRGRGLGLVSRVDDTLQKTQLQQLYNLLIQPIADLLPTNPESHVIFIPHQSLFLVPFAALQDQDGKYLIEKHTLLTAPSIQVLNLTHKQRQRIQQTASDNAVIVGISRKAVVVGNPTMPKVPPQIGEQPQPLNSLPGAEEEAKAIAEVLKTQALTGKQATKAAVMQQMSEARIIHLATHGLLEDLGGTGVPGAIALAPSGNDNGLLTANEVLNMKLNAELVVLSACDTGGGRITGDGVIGLSRAFITAGTPSLVVSLWKVSDEATAFLMPEFYRQLSSNPDKAIALRIALLATMKKYPNPRDWAAFTLIGEAE
jgi:CHAT domain-containing protein/Flp pilus assembly protein TadD